VPKRASPGPNRTIVLQKIILEAAAKKVAETGHRSRKKKKKDKNQISKSAEPADGRRPWYTLPKEGRTIVKRLLKESKVPNIKIDPFVDLGVPSEGRAGKIPFNDAPKHFKKSLSDLMEIHESLFNKSKSAHKMRIKKLLNGVMNRLFTYSGDPTWWAKNRVQHVLSRLSYFLRRRASFKLLKLVSKPIFALN